MLGKDVLMEDIDIDQWRNAQDLLLESSKEKRRIIVLHDNGVVRKCEHTDGIEIVGKPTEITDAPAQAKELYENNKDNVDFVAIFERSAFDEYLPHAAASWVADELLDSCTVLTRCSTSIRSWSPTVRHENLGLQYRFVSPATRPSFSRTVGSGRTLLLLGVYDEWVVFGPAGHELRFRADHGRTDHCGRRTSRCEGDWVR